MTSATDYYKQNKYLLYLFLIGVYLLGISEMVLYNFNYIAIIMIIGVEFIITMFALFALWESK